MNFYMLAELFCSKFHDEIYNYEECGFFEDIEEDEKKVKALLKEEDRKLVDIFKCGLINCHEEKDFYNIARAINYGVKIGMEFQEYLQSLIE